MGREGGAQRRGRLPAVGAEEGGRGGAGGCCGYRPCWCWRLPPLLAAAAACAAKRH